MPKNILLIISDQHRFDYTSQYMNIKTPNLEKIAENGLVFNSAVCVSPVCTPSRASLFTGRYPHELKGITGEGEDDDMMMLGNSLQEIPALSQKLREKGYEIALSGKWHIGDDQIEKWFDKSGASDQFNEDYIKWAETEHHLDKPWSFQDDDVRNPYPPHMSIAKTKVHDIPIDKHNDAWIADFILQFLEEKEQDKPFFYVCSFQGPHPPFKIPEPYYSMYDEKDFPEPANFRDIVNAPEFHKHSFWRQLAKEHGITWKPWAKSAAVYAGFVTLVDDQIGRILDSLKEKDLYEDTVIFYLSDHGELLGSHLFWQKFQPYEESVRIPLYIKVPNLPQRVEINDPVSMIDIANTILACADIKPLADSQGIDLTQYTDPNFSLGRKCFIEHRPKDFYKDAPWRAVRDNSYKLVWNNKDSWELYDLKNDPYELINVYKDTNQEIIGEYKDALQDHLKNTKDPLHDIFLSQL